ncbi:MAG TPA: heme-binding protein [Candidatus Dormibacteraeota bacterium]|nr:heme-binding protein [Candidatus Dormibacteraeota bacterium]
MAETTDTAGGARRFPLDNVDSFRGPTASQAAGLTLGAAKAMMKAAMAEGRRLGVALSVAVVDQGGQLVAFERMDAADLVTIGLAQDKAWTALMNRMPTRDLAPLVQPGAEFYGYASIGRGRTIVFAGGVPLLRDGVLVGGVGVSGGSLEEDQAAADAAVAAFG